MLKHLRSIEDRNQKRAGADGFTLIELLVVIVILGILAAVVVLGVGAIQDRGEEEACQTELRSIRAASAAYIVDPAPSDTPPGTGGGGTAASDTGVLLSAGYIDDTPEGSYTIATNGAVTQDTCG